MNRTPRRYRISLHLSGGQTEVVHFTSLDQFQDWYQGLVNASAEGAFVNVPLSDLDGEFLVVRPDAVIGMRVEPQYALIDDA
jgi:hypothetical protein